MNNYNSIDFNKIKELVLEYCSIEDSKTFIFDEEVCFNPLVIRKKIKETSEALKLLKDDFYLSFDGIENINDLFIKAKKDLVLNSFEFSKILIFHNHCKRIQNKMNAIDNELSIKDYSDSININDELAKRIEKVVDANGNIKEDASDRLYSINRSINHNLDSINKASTQFINANSSYLQENNVFSRNNRTTFLLKNTAKNKFKGYQYGNSSSGLATYVEPEQFVELNNRQNELENERIEEVNRILKELTYYVCLNSDNYILNFESLIKLDVVFAKAKFGYYKNGIISEINNDNYLLLKDVIHPLIDEKVVISNTYELNNDYQGIVISGTNTGGKTVGLKLIGLSVLMSYLGIPVLAQKANIPLYDNIYVDIDDNQSITNALSTFSAHISNINDILNNANERSLILIDELISGTDPKEAQAISLAILEEILKIKSKFIITTHYDAIKEFSFKNPLILLSSVGFNLDELKPTYKYIENSIGVSNAIEIANRYFDSKEIIENAKNYLNFNKTKEDELLEKLALKIKENDNLKEELENQINDNNRLNEELNIKLNNFNNEKERLFEQYKKELEEYLVEQKNIFKNKLENIKNKNSVKESIKIIDEIVIKEKEKEELKLNDYVKINDSSQSGKIIELNGENVKIDINGLIIKTRINNITKINKQEKKEYKPRERMNRVSSELNLVGERVDDALAKMDAYLDSAYGSNMESVKIIHGFGTGQLRSAIREHLKKNKIVKTFGNGDIYDGGSNVTIVKFK